MLKYWKEYFGKMMFGLAATTWIVGRKQRNQQNVKASLLVLNFIKELE
jgi:hypothetical protein